MDTVEKAVETNSEFPLKKRFNHWRSINEKVVNVVPHSVRGVNDREVEEKIITNDCSADPCSCTGCSDWD